MDIVRVDSLEREILIDPLTGIHNRRFLDRRLREEAARSRRYGIPLSVVFLDIDHFKDVNDRYGHQSGDQVLIEVSRRWGAKLRDVDKSVRYGGEEFVIITPHTTLSGASEIAMKLIKEIEAHPFTLTSVPKTVQLTCSAGVASLDEDLADSEALLNAADQSLYRAKQEGRNRVVVSTVVARAKK